MTSVCWLYEYASFRFLFYKTGRSANECVIMGKNTVYLYSEVTYYYLYSGSVNPSLWWCNAASSLTGSLLFHK
jgi:hypothetical protein